MAKPIARVCSFGLVLLIAGTGLQFGCKGGESGGSTTTADSNNLLASLSVSAGKLAPAFDPGIKDYEVALTTSTKNLRVMAQPQSAVATVSIAGADAASGTTMSSVTLSIGTNTIPVVVKAENGASNTYTIVVTVTVDANNLLAELLVSTGTLSPDFSPEVTSYTLDCTTDSSNLSLFPRAQSSTARVTVAGSVVENGSSSEPIALTVGSSQVAIVVTAEDGGARTYTITVNVVRSTNSNLARLLLSKGTLTPAFNRAVTSYSAGIYSLAPSIVVTPTAESPRATVRVNGALVSSGAASEPIALSNGSNSIAVEVTPEQGAAKTYTVEIVKYESTVDVLVLDSITGTALPSAVIDVADTAGKVLETGITVDEEGKASLGLDLAAKYDISAHDDDSAVSAFVELDPSRESSLALYCHALGMISYPAVAPVITAVEYSADGQSWIAVDAGQITSALAGIKQLRVTAVGRAGISPTGWSGFGIGVGVDKPVWAGDMVAASSILENSVATTLAGNAAFRSTFVFDLPITSFSAGTMHTIDVVVYDVANNRTEQKLYVTVTDGDAIGTDPDLSAVAVSNLTLKLITRGLSRNVFALPRIDENPITYAGDLTFNVSSSGTAPGIRGFEVHRSTDNATWKKIATTAFPSLSTGEQGDGAYSFRDIDPSLDGTTVYYYKVRAFSGNTTNNGGYTADSDVVSARFLPAHTVSLASPPTGSISATTTPTLTFTVSNGHLFDEGMASFFNFFVYVKDKIGTPIYLVEYRYNFDTAVNAFEAKDEDTQTWAATSDVTMEPTTSGGMLIHLEVPATVFRPCVTYEWSIFGTPEVQGAEYGASEAPYFVKYTDPASQAASALSYGSVYQLDYGAINGFYTLTIAPDAT